MPWPAKYSRSSTASSSAAATSIGSPCGCAASPFLLPRRGTACLAVSARARSAFDLVRSALDDLPRLFLPTSTGSGGGSSTLFTASSACLRSATAAAMSASTASPTGGLSGFECTTRSAPGRLHLTIKPDLRQTTIEGCVPSSVNAGWNSHTVGISSGNSIDSSTGSVTRDAAAPREPFGPNLEIDRSCCSHCRPRPRPIM